MKSQSSDPTSAAMTTNATSGSCNNPHSDDDGGDQDKAKRTPSDVTLSHTIDDDITFERVRHMPRRTQFVSTHRKLSWQYDKQVKQHERDQKLSHVELARAHTAMVEKLSRLKDAKKEVERKRSDPSVCVDRRCSAPSLPDACRGPRDSASRLKHSHSVSCFSDATTIPEDEAAAGQTSRRAVEAKLARVGRAGRRATIAEGVTGPTSLPPDLLRRLSQFMDSTSALLLTTNSGDGRREDSLSKPADDFSEVDRLPEQPEPEAEAV